MCFVPGNRGMTVAARVCPECFTMRTLICMTSSACWINGLIFSIGMTTRTVHLLVTTFQGEATHSVMIKKRISSLETLRLMAAVTVKVLKLSLMRILMTAVASTTLWLPAFPTVTIQAKRALMFALKRPACLFMIEVHPPQEACSHVAIFTFEISKNSSGMWILMT